MLDEAQKQDLLIKVNEALNSIRPHLQADGGDVVVMGLTDQMQVQIKWVGMCESCSMSSMTLKAGIEEAIRNKVPEIVGVEPLNGVFVA